jgi:amidase
MPASGWSARLDGRGSDGLSRRCARPPSWQTKLWLGDSYEAQLAAAEREGDPGALACLRGNKTKVFPFDAADFSKALVRRATLAREWLLFLERYAVLVMPVSGELPFPDHLDRKDDASFARVWKAQLAQIAIPFMGRPGLTVRPASSGRVPVGRAGRCRTFPRGSLPCGGRGDRGGRSAASPVDPQADSDVCDYDFTA